MRCSSEPRRHAGLDRIASVSSRVLSAVSGIALASAVLAVTGSPGAHAQTDPSFDRFVVVQPIKVCDDAGNNCAVVNTFHAGTAKALGQANVLPIFLPTSQFNNTALRDANEGPGSFVPQNGGSSDLRVINMWFTGRDSIKKCGGDPGSIIGCADIPFLIVPAREIVIDAQLAIHFLGFSPYSNAIAHEMGHNFGLEHVDRANTSNLMAPEVDSRFYDEIGVTRNLLNADQIEEIRNNGFFEFELVREASNFNGGPGIDVVSVLAGTAFQNIFGNGGNDSITLNAGSGVLANVEGGAGSDTISVLDGSIVGGNVSGGVEDDTLIIGGKVLRNVLGDEGSDTIIVLSTAQIVRGVDGGSGDDTIEIAGAVTADLPIGPLPSPFAVATVPSPTQVMGGIGADTILLKSGANVMGSVFGDNKNVDETGHGNDLIIMTGGEVAGNIHGEGGNDTIIISGGVVR